MQRSRAVRLVSEIVAACAIVGAIIVYSIYVPSSKDIADKWVALVVNTFVVFGMLAHWFALRRQNVRFWFIFLLLVAVHSIIYAAVLYQVNRWPLVLFAFTDVVEWLALSPVLAHFDSRIGCHRGTDP